jgi:putative peptidoglycan lipid II flippase
MSAAETAPASPKAPSGGGGLGSTLKVSALTMASRLLGLVREQLFAALLGAGFFTDAFNCAFRIPNLLRDLFAEGALSAAFVPTFSQVETEKGKDAAHLLANRLCGALLVIIGTLTLLGVVFARQVVWALAPGFAAEPGKLELTAQLTRIMMPFLLLVSLAAVMMGMLNARGRFSLPALAPSLFNVAAIVAGAGLWLSGAGPQVAVVGWSLGTLFGGFLQFTVQVPQLWRDGYRPVPRLLGVWSDPAIRRIARLMAPATLGLAAVQVNILINTQFASSEPGAISWLNFAFRLMYLPIGIFGVAIATVTASSLARRAAQKDLAGVRAGLNQGLRHVAFLTLPSTIGLFVLAEPIIGLIYQHGRFTPSDTTKTAWALASYSMGLYAYSGVKVAAPAFYALDRVRFPLLASAAAVLTNLAVNGLAHRYLMAHGAGFIGIAFGTSLGAMVNLVILAVAFRRLTRDVAAPKGLFLQLGKVLLASALMGLGVGASEWLLRSQLVAHGAHAGLVHLVCVLVCVPLGAVAYAAACRALKVSELDEVISALRRRAGRGAKPPAAPASP